jgi:choline dehydrogenase-like flavoprotein
VLAVSSISWFDSYLKFWYVTFIYPTLAINSNEHPDPTKPPVIDPAYLKHPADRAVLAAGLKFCDRVAKSQAVVDKIHTRVIPEPSVDLEDLKQGEKAVEDWCMGEYHPIGSCSMGDVLDSKLKVKGVKGLRVCDASVFPNNVSGNIVSSVYAVAEKGADLIKEEYGF